MEKLKSFLMKLLVNLIAPYDDEMKYSEAIDMVCRKCKYGDGYCSLCPVELSCFGNGGEL